MLVTHIFDPNKVYTDREKADTLQAMSCKQLETEYQRPLSSEELEKEKHNLSDAMIKLGSLEQKLSEFRTNIKAEMKPLILLKEEALQKIKTRQVEEEGVIYLIDDQEDGMMGRYDRDGIMIDSRRLFPEEKQRNIFSGIDKVNISIVDRGETRREGTND